MGEGGPKEEGRRAKKDGRWTKEGVRRMGGERIRMGGGLKEEGRWAKKDGR